MKARSIQWWLLFSAVAVMAIGSVSTPALAAPSSQQSATTVQLANNPKFGNILVDSAGMTLYTLSSEAGGTIQCSADCLTFWPPLLLPAGTSAPAAPTGLIGTLGTVVRPDGTTQVTYNGFPLYTFAGDKAAGDTNGDGVVLGSGVWHVAAEAASTPSTPPSTGSAPLQTAVNPSLGPILVNPQGLTLYYNTNELAGHVVCLGKCLGAWAPLEIAGGTTVPAIPGVTANISSFTNPGGGNQVTYNSYPLYTFVKDTAPGDVNGEGIKAFGGVWLVARPNAVPLSASLAARLTLRITSTAGHVWGKIALSYSRDGNRVLQTCAAATCRLVVPAGILVRLQQTPRDASTWPFQEWKLRSGAGSQRVIMGSTVQFKITGDSRVTTVYKVR